MARSPHCVALLAPFAAFLGTACLAPPPEDASTAKAQDGPVLVIFDGDGGGLEGGQSWADCDTKPGCKATLMSAPGKGRNGSGALAFHAVGPNWAGGGWNWLGWYPEDGGTDLRPYSKLKLWLRVEAASPDKAPGKDGITLLLGCSAGKKTSAAAVAAKYADGDILDGEWHEVVVPLGDLYVGKDGEAFDPATAWELKIGTWDATPRDFTIYLDDIAVEK